MVQHGAGVELKKKFLSYEPGGQTEVKWFWFGQGTAIAPDQHRVLHWPTVDNDEPPRLKDKKQLCAKVKNV